MATLVAIALFLPAVFAAAPIVSVDQQQEQAVATVQQQNSRDQLIAEQQIQITALQEEIRQLRGMIEEQDYKISQLLERQRELYRDLDQRLSDLSSKAPASSSVSPSVSANSTAANNPTDAVAAHSEPAPVVPPTPVDKPKTQKIDAAKANAKLVEEEQSAYDAIFPLVRNKQYAEAAKSYQDFLQAYPTGKNAANARYWLGQIYNVQNQLEEADTQFKLVVTQYPDSGKAHEALLKLGEIAKKRGQHDAAKGFFQKVLQQYPDSASARVAQQKLQDLK